MQRDVAPRVFVDSARLLVCNPILLVPGVVFGSLGALANGLLGPAEPLDSNFWIRALQAVISVLTSILAISFTTGMADAAWRTDRCGLGDGARAFGRDGSHVFLAMLVLSLAGAVAAILAPFTAGISLFVYVLLFIYTMAAAVVGERPGLHAARESIEIFIARPAQTLLLTAGITVVAVVASFIAAALSATPYVGPLVAALLVQIIIAYITLVIVGEYRALSLSR